MKTLFFIAVVIGIISCKKDDPQTLIDYLAMNDWQKTVILISADSVLDTVPTIDIFTPRPDCQKDNVWHFDASDNTFQNLEGATKCNVSDPDIKDFGILVEQDGGASLLVDGTGNDEIWEIESRQATSFQVSYFGKFNGQTRNFRVVFTKF